MASPSDRRTRESLRDDIAALRIDRSAGPPSRSRLPLLLGVVALIGALAAAAFYFSPFAQPAPVRVGYALRTVDSAAPGVPRTALTGSGYVVTEAEYIALGVRVSGRIVEYLVDEGDHVAKGQELVRLDARPFEADRARLNAERAVAQANVELRRKELTRLTKLYTRDVSAEAEVDLKENQLKVAQAELARSDAELTRIRLDLEDTVLRSPVAGVVLAKLKEVGEMAVPGGFQGSGELIRLANLQELRAELDVNESDLAKVWMGQDATVVPDADPSRHYDARVVELAPQVNRQKGTLRVEVRILEPDSWLRPDMSVRMHFLEAASEAPKAGQVLAPSDAIRNDAKGTFAWVVSQGRVHRQTVKAGAGSSGQVAIDSGLLGGEALVLGDALSLSDGERVRVEPDAPGSPPARP